MLQDDICRAVGHDTDKYEMCCNRCGRCTVSGVYNRVSRRNVLPAGAFAGHICYVEDEDQFMVFDGVSWKII